MGTMKGDFWVHLSECETLYSAFMCITINEGLDGV